MALYAGRVPLRQGAWIASLILFLGAASSMAQEVFVHETTASNTLGATSLLDHPVLESNPFVRVTIQQVANPGGGPPGVVQAAYFGLRYSSSTGRWAIDHQDGDPVSPGLRFFVSIDPSGIVHDAEAGNTASDATEIDDPGLNDKHSGYWMSTYFSSRDGGSGPENPHPTGMSYDSDSGRWSLVNLDGASMPSGGGFFVSGEGYGGIPPATVPNRLRHQITELSTSLLPYRTYFDGSNDLLGLPDAVVFATWDATNGMLNPHPMAVGYDESFDSWYVDNVDGAALPVGGVVMIHYDAILFADGFESGDVSGWTAAVP